MLGLDLSSLSIGELEKVVGLHCAQFGRVTSVTIERGNERGGLNVVIRMSSVRELDNAHAALGGEKRADGLVVSIAHDVSPPPGRVPRHASNHHPARRTRPANILLVEDDPADVWMTREALRATGTNHQLHIVGDGQEAIEFLYREGRFTAAPLPDLILLDLNLPKVSGLEVLLEIKTSGHLKHIPVVVLTSSGATSDVRRSYQRNADCYVTKVTGLDAFTQEIKVVEALLPH